ncbi:MAG: bifunctional diaminohydroxyphosphoribosylaminopyrimidine deaminase/5-amino-6-(5-phosphoribosylamino)uracil reductase RibD [Fusobacterium sp.]
MDQKYMNLALNLALKGEGHVNPNPLVGAVVVKNNKIIGEGYHKIFGGPHAEVFALNQAGEDAKGATIYVTLEPCSHQGKTSPCVNKIKEMGIKKCVIGTLDPNPLVSGKGKKILEDAGIEVVVGVLEKEAKNLNKVFFKYIQTKKPYLFLKCAITLDGKIATNSNDSKWITNELAREKVQKLRNKYSGIMVGINTLINDNPRLTARIENGRNPFRIVVDPYLKTPINSNFVNMDDGKSIIVTSKNNIIDYKKIEIFDKIRDLTHPNTIEEINHIKKLEKNSKLCELLENFEEINQSEEFKIIKKLNALEHLHNLNNDESSKLVDEEKYYRLQIIRKIDLLEKKFNFDNLKNIYLKTEELKKRNIKFIYLDAYNFSVDEILDEIGKLDIDSVLLEGGAFLISKAFSENRIDGGEIFIAPKILGGGLPFIDGFNFKTIKEGFNLENVKFNIFQDNISVEFDQKK